jgi:hypothetical protein
MNTQLLDLERLRQELDKARNTIGMTYDYLDYGRPDAEQKASAERSIAVMQRQADALDARLAAEVRRLRREAPIVIDAWVGLHLSVLDDILQETTGADYLSHDDIRHFVAKQTISAWREVLDGSRTYVHINVGFLDDYEARLLTRMPMLDPAVRKRADALEKNIGKSDTKLEDGEAKHADRA